MKKCKCCGSSCIDNIKIRHGYICSDCRNVFPVGLIDSMESMNIDKIKELKGIFDKSAASNNSRCVAWSKHFKISADSIILDGKAVRLSELEKVEISLHPTDYADSSRVVGIPVIRLFFKNSRAVIEYEMTEEKVIFGYIIKGRNISYEPTFAFREISEKINHAIKTGNNLSAYVNTVFESERRKTEEARHARENAERVRREKEEREREKRYREEDNRSKNERNKETTGSSADTDKAYLEFFELTMPFTESELKKARNRLMKKYHPDVPGGSDEKCKYINEAFDRLSHLAA